MGSRGASGRALLASGRRWRLPITYGSIASIALGVDLALILGSATFAETVYHKIPDEFAGEYSHTLAAAIFVAILFVAAMRVQKLYSPTRLMVWEDQARAVLGAWCGAFLILASGVFSWGVSHDLSRGDVLLFWASRRRGASRAPGGVEICAAARTGKRGAEGAHDRQRDVRARVCRRNSPRI